MTMHADIDVTLSRIRDVRIEHGAPGDTWAKITVLFGHDSLVIRVCDEPSADELSDAFAEAARRLNRRDAEALSRPAAPLTPSTAPPEEAIPP